MSRKSPDLDAAYSLRTPEDSRRLYRDWAESYDSGFVAENDYRLPFEVANAYAATGAGGPVLDVGAGTGLAAKALAAHGVGPVDGLDISSQMLAVARGKALYRHLIVADVTLPLGLASDSYAGILSAGTFTLGHVGPEALDVLLKVAAPGAQFVIAVNASHFRKAGFARRLKALSDRITDLGIMEVPIYGDRATGEHAGDRADLLQFRKAD